MGCANTLRLSLLQRGGKKGTVGIKLYTTVNFVQVLTVIHYVKICAYLVLHLFQVI